MYPPLAKDHKVLGHEYCSGYTDAYGKWNTGFYCPPMSADSVTVLCCGTSDYKYCCSGDSPPNPTKAIVEMETEMEITNDYDPLSAPDIGRNSYVAAVICGLVAVTVLMTLVSCFYCSCCLLYKKRRAQLPGGLYRIPASSTTCGLINSANGSTTPNSLVTSPMNPVFTSNSWGINNFNNHPLQGQLSRINPPQPQPPSSERANMNPILNGDINHIQTSLRYHQPPAPIPANTNASRLHRQISLLQRQNPNIILRTVNNTQNVHNIPTIYNTTGRFSTNGTMSSIISSVSSSGSTSSLPPPYFLEQYRIRNRVRQPRNPAPAVLLPSYNEIQRQACSSTLTSNDPIRNLHSSSVPSNPQQPQPSQSQSQPQSQSPSIPCTMMNDLSAPPRRRHPQTEILNGQIMQVSNLPVSPLREECQPPRDKILNTSIQQRTSSDTRRLQEALQEIRRKTSTASRNRIKSPSTENVVPASMKPDVVALNVELELRSNQAHPS